MGIVKKQLARDLYEWRALHDQDLAGGICASQEPCLNEISDDPSRRKDIWRVGDECRVIFGHLDHKTVIKGIRRLTDLNVVVAVRFASHKREERTWTPIFS